MKNILFIAPPAGGKGTQSDLLVSKYGYDHISTGDLLRKLDKSSPLGIKVNKLISEGKLVDDEIVLELLKEKLETLNDEKSFILDGFPRNIVQAEKLDVLLNRLNKKLDLVIELDVPYEVTLKRAIGRETCPKCNKIYNKFFLKPKNEGICDACNTPLTSRSDDSEETYKTRYSTYLESTLPLIDYYKKSGNYIKIDGINDTFKLVEENIK